MLRSDGKYGDKAKILERGIDSEMWTMDKDTLNAFVEDLKTGAGSPKR